jgi:hypothetical protein
MILDYCLGDFKFCYFQVDSTLKIVITQQI